MLDKSTTISGAEGTEGRKLDTWNEKKKIEFNEYKKSIIKK